MPPKTHKRSIKSSVKPSYEVDVDKIPEYHRETLDLGDELDYDTVKYMIQCVICYIRGVAYYKGAVIGHKHVGTVPNTYSNDTFFLLTILYDKCSTKLVFNLYDLYLYGFTCDGSWYYPLGSSCTIKGGAVAAFKENYPSDKVFKIGVHQLRMSVKHLHHKDSSNWEEAYYDIAANIAESVRFDFVLLSLLGSVPGENAVLIDDFKKKINNWGGLSKMWKLFYRYDKWNPLEIECDVKDPKEARALLCFVKNVDIGVEIQSISSVKPAIPVVDKTVK